MEPLERRDLLAPTLSGFVATPQVPLAGATLLLAVDATSVNGVRGVTFFRDVDLNGSWSPGVDESIGDVFVRDPQTLKYQKSLVAPAAWGRNARILADAVDTLGAWSSGALPAATVTVNQKPAMLTFSASTSAVNTGQTFTMTATASDDSAVRLVTFYIDRDNNGRFTPGLDSPLGDVISANGLGQYVLSAQTDSTWPLNARLLADAVDFDGVWTGAPAGTTVRVGSPTPPTITSFTATTGRGSTSPTVTLVANATDNLGVRAVTFFQDCDGNGRWTPGVDLSLGTLFSADAGHPGRYTLTVATDFGGNSSASYVADAVDLDGTWTTTPSTATAAAERYAFIQSFSAEMLGAALARVKVTAWIPPWFATAAGSVDSVLFAQDINGNDVYDPGVDIDLGTPTTMTANGAYRDFEKFAAVDGTQPAPLKFLAAVPLTANLTWADPKGPIRVAEGRQQNNIPTIDTISVLAGLDLSTNLQTYVNPGTRVVITVNATANFQIDVVTFFFDRNMNGRWDPGVDVDLGFQRAPAGTTTALFQYSGVIPEAATGFGAFTAAVKDLSGRARDEWGPTRALQVTPVYAVPKISLPSTATAARGNPLTIDFTASDDFGVRASSGFIDANRNNAFDGSDISSTSFSLVSGTPTSGRWRLSFNTISLTAGTYTVYLAGLDFYQGNANGPGGLSSGFWGPRFAVTVTIT